MKLSPQPTVHERVSLTNVELGPWTEVGSDSVLENVVMGAYSYTGPQGFFQNTTIGKFANIAAQVRIGPTMHPMDRPTLHHFTYRRSWYDLAESDDEAFFAWRRAQTTDLGHDTWVGHGAIIMPGLTLGTGSVVGAGAVVTKDVPPYTVVAGVPARIIKRRFDETIASTLLRMEWWNWDHETLKARLEDFSGPVEAFLEKWARS